MKIGMCLEYPLTMLYYRTMHDFDVLDFPPLVAAKELAAEGHECTFFGWCHDSECDRDYLGQLLIVHSRSSEELREEALKRGPYDRFFSNEGPSAFWRGALANGGKYYHMIHEDCSQRWYEGIGSLPVTDGVAVLQDYMSAALKYVYHDLKVAVTGVGVHTELATTFKKPLQDRTKTLFMLGDNIRKGAPHMAEVAEELKKMGVDVHGPCSKSTKKEFFEMLSDFKFVYFPSIMEGYGRALCEAVCIGVRPIVAAESLSSLGLNRWIHPLVITTGGYLHSIVELRFLRPPSDVAREIVKAMETPFEQWHPEPDALNARYAIDKLKAFILS